MIFFTLSIVEPYIPSVHAYPTVTAVAPDLVIYTDRVAAAKARQIAARYGVPCLPELNIICDVDDTLVSSKGYLKTADKICQRIAELSPASFDDVKRIHDEEFHRQREKHGFSRMLYYEQARCTLRRIMAQYDRIPTVQLENEVAAIADDNFEYTAPLLEGVLPGLQQLISMGMKLWNATRGEEHIQYKRLTDTNTHVFFPKDRFHCWPDKTPAHYRRMRQTCRLFPDWTVMVGDGRIADVDYASKAGFRTILVQGTTFTLDDGIGREPDAIVNTLTEIPLRLCELYDTNWQSDQLSA
jgi:FMN phosphatase YigB (HAD superfamily)